MLLQLLKNTASDRFMLAEYSYFHYIVGVSAVTTGLIWSTV